MPLGFLSGQEIIYVVLIVALIFGASRLPVLARNFGLGIKEFRRGVKEAGEDDTDSGTSKASGGSADGTAAPSANGTGASDDVTAKRRD